ncbi:hypothetical protein GCM10009069_08940 [Algimonas arctica]|uniref:Uncharacterized protein n=1 Tax=Algimonas arctica TaxID=1479486 RepID=A0A8J3CRE8_9PROT|nr:hypothetical protein [Algimonas arctica]GHA88201.1 hypothetical protein GCM10009069_08940 [Algimonas arctica]
MRLRQKQTEKAARAAHHTHGTGLSGSPITEGDDLNRSRYFSLKAGTEMTAIIDADRTHTNTGLLSKGRDPAWLCERLGIIQREAKRARARAVYRSAQDALGLIQRCNVHMPIDWTRVDGRLFVLNKLLGQYEAGLLDVETEIRLVDPTALADEVPSDALTHKCAKQTLSSLLPHASDQERAALSRLMDIDQTPVREPITDLAPDLATETDSLANPAQTVSVDRIEWIMPGLVQKLLEFGRQYEKIFSVSHSLDDVLIDAGSADTVQARLFERLSDLIASNLPLQGVGRLDICASENELLISGSGFDSFAIPLSERVEETLETLASNIDPDPVTPARRPMITDDTEGELRAQLAALMDGGLANFNGADQ